MGLPLCYVGHSVTPVAITMADQWGKKKEYKEESEETSYSYGSIFIFLILPYPPTIWSEPNGFKMVVFQGWQQQFKAVTDQG